MRKIRRSYSKLSGTTWSSTKHKPSRIIWVVAGKCFYSSMLETDSCWQEHLFRTLWLSFGHCFISLCLSCSIITSSSRSGFQKILRHPPWTKVSWINISSSDSTQSLNHLCSEGSKETLSRKLGLRQRLRSPARWPIDREFFTRESRTRWALAIYSSSMKTSKRWRIWWT